MVPKRYRIASLDAEGLDVWLTVGPHEIIGRVRFTASGKPRFQERITKTTLQDLAKEACVALWRPMDESTWPYELPDPATLTKEIARPVPAPSEGEDAIPEGPGWPYSHIRLGRPGEPPESVLEVEARLLRGLRTQHVLERDSQSAQTLWLRALMVDARVIEKRLKASRTGQLVGFRKSDYDDFYIDKSELNARPVPFCPTPRDISDYEDKIVSRWLSYVPKRDRWYFAARSKLPPLSWRQIADEEREHEHVIKGRYRDALKAILRQVK